MIWFQGLLALLPGVYAWRSGRRLAGRLQDPALPERLFRRQQHLVWLWWLACLPAALSGPVPWRWALMTTALLSIVAAGQPLRRALFDDDRPLYRVVFHALRLILGLFFPWMILMPVPLLVYHSEAITAGTTTLPILVAIALLLLAWTFFLPTMAAFLLGAKPLADPDLLAALAPIQEKSTAPAPAILQTSGVGPRPNAFAMPAAGPRGGVLFLEGLLHLLGEEETKAIFAHEMAHLEHFTRRKVLLGGAVLLILLALGAALGLHLPAVPETRFEVFFLWLCGLVVFVSVARASHKNHEGASDLRALELTGDAPALINALTKLHGALRVPRQWTRLHELEATHPSLAQRIRALRQAADIPQEAMVPWLLRGDDEPRQALLLEAHRCTWFEGLPPQVTDSEPLALERLLTDTEASTTSASVRTFPYGQLRQLRLEVRGFKPRLLFQGPEGPTRRLRLSSEQLSGAQEALSRIDHQLPGTAAAASGPEHRFRVLGRILALIGLVVGIMPSVPWAVAVVHLLAALKPSRSHLLAAAVVAVGATAQFLAQPPLRHFLGGLAPTLALILGLLALGLLLSWSSLNAAAKKRGAPAPESQEGWRSRLPTLFLVIAATLSWLPLLGYLSGELSRTGLHLWARDHPSATLFPAALAALLFYSGRRPRRWAWLPLAAAIALAAPSTLWFRSTASEDPFRTSLEALAPTDLVLEASRFVALPGLPTAFRLPPQGDLIAAHLAYDPHDQDRYKTGSFFLVENKERGFHRIEALDLVLAEGPQIVILHGEDERPEVTRETLPEREIVQEWQPAPWQEKELAALDGRIFLLGLDWESGDRRLLELGADASRPLATLRPGAELSAGSPMTWSTERRVNGAGEVLEIEALWPDDSFFNSGAALGLARERLKSRLYRLGTTRPPETLTSALEPQCLGTASSSSGDFLCAVSEGYRTTLWQWSQGSPPTPILTVKAAAEWLLRVDDQRLLLAHETGLTLIDLATAEAWRLHLGSPPLSSLWERIFGASKAAPLFPSLVAANGTHLVTLEHDAEDGQVARVYPLPPQP